MHRYAAPENLPHCAHACRARRAAVRSAEHYISYDPLSQTLVSRREAMRVSWFATGGTLAVDASAVGEADLATSVSTTWHTPAAGPATLWLVLRDSRGGITSQILSIEVGSVAK